MTREEAIQILADLIDSPFLHTWEKQNKALHMAIEALSAPQTDLISRADAIKAVASITMSIHLSDVICDKLLALPSADAPKGDLISRQWLLEVYGDYIGDNGEPKYHVPLEVVRQNIKDAPSAEAEWIPCSDRLPSEKDGEVLVTKCDEVRIATYSEFSGTWYVGEMCAVGGEDPIAWKPKPEPYRKDGEDYKLATEQMEHDAMYEPTYSSEDGSM